MARYKCKNCGKIFRVDVKRNPLGKNQTCPKCGSTWTEYLGPDSGSQAIWDDFLFPFSPPKRRLPLQRITVKWREDD